MKNLRNLFATFILTVIFMLGSSSVQAGILMTDLNNDETKTQRCGETAEDTKVDSGIIVHFTGIIVHFTGIIIHIAGADTNNECGIIVHD